MNLFIKILFILIICYWLYLNYYPVLIESNDVSNDVSNGTLFLYPEAAGFNIPELLSTTNKSKNIHSLANNLDNQLQVITKKNDDLFLDFEFNFNSNKPQIDFDLSGAEQIFNNIAIIANASYNYKSNNSNLQTLEQNLNEQWDAFKYFKFNAKNQQRWISFYFGDQTGFIQIKQVFQTNKFIPKINNIYGIMFDDEIPPSIQPKVVQLFEQIKDSNPQIKLGWSTSPAQAKNSGPKNHTQPWDKCFGQYYTEGSPEVSNWYTRPNTPCSKDKSNFHSYNFQSYVADFNTSDTKNIWQDAQKNKNKNILVPTFCGAGNCQEPFSDNFICLDERMTGYKILQFVIKSSPSWPGDIAIWYGTGWQPFCNLQATDSSNVACLKHTNTNDCINDKGNKCGWFDSSVQDALNNDQFCVHKPSKLDFDNYKFPKWGCFNP